MVPRDAIIKIDLKKCVSRDCVCCGFFIQLLFVSVRAAGSSVIVHDDPTSRGPTAAAADPQSSAAPSPAAAAESTHVTPGTVSVLAITARWGTRVFDKSDFHFSLQQQIQEVFKNQQEQLSMQLLQQKNAGIVSQEVTEAHSGILLGSV